MSERVIVSTWRGPLGTATLSVYGPTGARAEVGVGSEQTLTLLEAPGALWGTLTPKYGGGILAHELTFRLSDPDGVLDALRTAYDDEADVYATLETADGRGGTAYAHAKITGVTAARTLSPRVDTLAAVEAEARCGLAKMAEADAAASEDETVLSVLVSALSAAEPTDGVACAVALALRPSDPAPDGGDAAAPKRVRFTGKVAGSDSLGDNGTAEDAALAMAGTFTLSLFQPARWPALSLAGIGAGEPRFYALPRSRVGLGLSVLDHDGTAGTLPAASYSAPSSTRYADGEWGYLPRLGRLEFEPTPDVAEAKASATEGLGVAVPAGTTYSTAAFSLVPDADLQLRLTVSRERYTDSPGQDETPGHVAVRLEGSDGTTYYGTASGWGTGVDYAIDGESGSPTTEAVIPLTLPASGTVFIDLVGDTATINPDPGPSYDVDAVFNSAALAIENEADDSPVTDVHVTVGNAGYGARTASVPLMPSAEVYASSSWQAVTTWESDVSGGSAYALLSEATAAERLATEGGRLRYVRATLHGVLLGPETRVVFPGTSTDAASPFPSSVACVAVGLRWDLARGCTEGLWVEAGEGGYTKIPA